MQTVQMELAQLHKTEINVRNHSAKQLKEYVRSVEMFGQIRPLVVTEDGEILCGNGLYDAMTSAGFQTADCYVLKGLSDKQKKKLILADNKIYELGSTDFQAFDTLVKGLEGDIDVPGYDESMLKMLNQAAAAIEDYNPPKVYRQREDEPIQKENLPFEEDGEEEEYEDYEAVDGVETDDEANHLMQFDDVAIEATEAEYIRFREVYGAYVRAHGDDSGFVSYILG